MSFQYPASSSSKQFNVDEYSASSCNICYKSFSADSLLKKHMTEVHNIQGPYVCHTCNKSYWTLIGLSRHDKQIHKGKVLNCPVCDVSIAGAQNWSLKRHLKAKHNVTCCTSCMKVFPQDDALLHVC